MNSEKVSLPNGKERDKVLRFLKKNMPCWLYIVPVILGKKLLTNYANWCIIIAVSRN